MITISVVQGSLLPANDFTMELGVASLSKDNGHVDLTDGQYLGMKQSARDALYAAMVAGYVIAVNEFGASLTAADVLAGSIGVVNLSLNGVQVYDDEAATLTFGVTKQNCYWNTALIADRAVALSTIGAVEGAKFKITRVGGAFNLNVGTGPLKAVPANAWCEVTFDGTAWFLSKYGTL